MSYTSKYTGQEIDNLLSSIDGTNVTKKVLWEGDLDTQNESVTLSESLENFDYLVLSVKHIAVSSGVDYVRYLPDTWIETSKIKSTGYKYGTTEPIFQTPTYSDPVNNVMRQASYTFSSPTTVRCEVVQLLGGTAGTMSVHLTKVVGIKFAQSSVVGGSASNPIGAIIPVMGTQAPQDYLVCDGSELNISEYGALADYFEKQFGSKNYFGGDGATTFAVPDLRNEFLRGYGDRTNEIGIHQDATTHRSFRNNAEKVLIYANQADTHSPMNEDEAIKINTHTAQINVANWVTAEAGKAMNYTSRPTNVAVLFCIKYTESASAGSRRKVVELLGGPVEYEVNKDGGNLSIQQNLLLSDDIANYDEIVFSWDINTLDGYGLLREQRFSTSMFLYNNTENRVFDGSIFQLIYATSAFFAVTMWFRNGTTIRVDDTQTNITNWNGIRIRSIRGIKY